MDTLFDIVAAVFTAVTVGSAGKFEQALSLSTALAFFLLLRAQTSLPDSRIFLFSERTFADKDAEQPLSRRPFTSKLFIITFIKNIKENKMSRTS
jgi:hypothetical protein